VFHENEILAGVKDQITCIFLSEYSNVRLTPIECSTLKYSLEKNFIRRALSTTLIDQVQIMTAKSINSTKTENPKKVKIRKIIEKINYEQAVMKYSIYTSFNNMNANMKTVI